MKIAVPSHLSDADLVAELKRLAGCEREATVHLITHLAELDARQLYLGAGFSSLFTYCTDVLRLSEDAAYSRIQAARAARRFPRILDMLGDGSLNLTTARLLAPHLTADNHQQLLAAGAGRSKRETEALVARLVPRPDVPSAVRRLPAPKPIPEPPVLASITAASTPTAGPHDGVNPAAPSASLELAAQAAAPPPSRRRPVVSALSPDRYQISFTASAKTIEKLRLAQDLLRHTVPTGDTAEIFDRALTALLEDLARKKCAATQRPRPGRGAAKGSRHIPAAVRRKVWLRDRGRCAFVGKGGRRCGERGFLEFHHLEPYAAGGSATVENIQLRCRAHNVYEAELYFGPIKHDEGIISELRAAYGRLDERATRSGTSRSGPPQPARFRLGTDCRERLESRPGACKEMPL